LVPYLEGLTIAENDLNAIAYRIDGSDHCTVFDLVAEFVNLGRQGVHLAVQVFDLALEILARHSTCKAGDNGGTCEDEFEMLVHK